ncbi:hypothetical protein, partial [Pseudoalteromonas sp. XI10]|uniref:hypothetical protein n=1 Tax=Pseudoalteromonas sp. XI10 TaxID=1766621 RepID=UPI000A6CB240
TVSLVYRVELSKSRDTGYLALFDDAFVYLQLADDEDLDSVLDDADFDVNNDGIIDEAHYETNLLKNNTFKDGVTYWERSDLAQPTHTNRN